VVRPRNPSHFTCGFTTLTHLSKPQHHDSRDLRRVVHGHDVVPSFPTTSHCQDAFEALDWCSKTRERIDPIGRLGHNLGTASSQRPCVRYRRRPQSPSDADALCGHDWFAARSISVAQARSPGARCLRNSAYRSATKAIASLAHSVDPYGLSPGLGDGISTYCQIERLLTEVNYRRVECQEPKCPNPFDTAPVSPFPRPPPRVLVGCSSRPTTPDQPLACCRFRA
jgi:hypothetical protein